MSEMNKAQTLTQFLIQNPQDNVTKQIDVSERFRKAGFKFTISAMTGKQFAEYQKQATAIGRHRKINFDSQIFNELVVINHTLEPNFKDAGSIKQAGCQTPEEFMYKSLLAGEILDLSSEISTLSGFDKEVDELVDEVKNS